MQSSIQSAKTRPGADCGSDHELLIAKLRLKLKKVGKTTRPFRYDLNQLPYDYTVKVKSLSHVQLFAIPWTVVYQASLSMGFSRQEYWNGLPFPSPGNLPEPGIESSSRDLLHRRQIFTI